MKHLNQQEGDFARCYWNMVEKPSAKGTESSELLCSLPATRNLAQKRDGFCLNEGISAQLFSYLLIICSSNPQTRRRAWERYESSWKKSKPVTTDLIQDNICSRFLLFIKCRPSSWAGSYGSGFHQHLVNTRGPAWNGAGATTAWSHEEPRLRAEVLQTSLAGRWAHHRLEELCFPALLDNRELISHAELLPCFFLSPPRCMSFVMSLLWISESTHTKTSPKLNLSKSSPPFALGVPHISQCLCADLYIKILVTADERQLKDTFSCSWLQWVSPTEIKGNSFCATSLANGTCPHSVTILSFLGGGSFLPSCIQTFPWTIHFPEHCWVHFTALLLGTYFQGAHDFTS